MDVDIDIKPGTNIKSMFTCVKASRVQDNKLKPHNVGYYFQTIPSDPVQNIAAIPYDVAEELGYFKIDFLNLNILDKYKSRDEIKQELKQPFNWKLLENKDFVGRLFHIGNYADFITKVKPQSILELAECIALIRPGKIKYMQAYLENNERSKIFDGEDQSYSFKKGHAIAYAMNVILHARSLVELNT